MATPEETLERLEQEVPAKAAIAVKQAYATALRSGRTVLIVEGDDLLSVAPNGSKTLVKKVQPSVKIPKGTKYKVK